MAKVIRYSAKRVVFEEEQAPTPEPEKTPITLTIDFDSDSKPEYGGIQQDGEDMSLEDFPLVLTQTEEETEFPIYLQFQPEFNPQAVDIMFGEREPISLQIIPEPAYWLLNGEMVETDDQVEVNSDSTLLAVWTEETEEDPEEDPDDES